MLRRLTILLIGSLGFLPGCTTGSATTRPSRPDEAALRDPADYKPNIDTDISGGDLGNLDRRAMRKDVDSVLNP